MYKFYPFLLLGLLSASAFAQQVTLSERDSPLKKVFDIISRQTGYDFLISTENLKVSKPVTITVSREALPAVLDKIFTAQPLRFVIQDKMVVVSAKDERQHQLPVKGRVTDTTGVPLIGASVKIKGTPRGTLSDLNGDFAIAAAPGEWLEVDFMGYDPYAVRVDGSVLPIRLRQSNSGLNEIQVIGYGATTKRLNTGSLSAVKAAVIEKQPVTNVLSALSGRMPGVFVQTTNGLPGGNINIQIRGKGSLTAGTNPLYIIDGVPFEAAGYGTTGQFSSSIVSGQLSPLNSINPGDIESITILKDADATAIYGSRGTNGVVLINTKRGGTGQTSASLSLSRGISQAAVLPKNLSTADYLQIRREAFANDQLTPNATNAPDLLVWDQRQYTDWGKYLFGNTAHATDVQGNLSGGDARAAFALSGNFHQEGNVISDAVRYRRGGMHFAFSHRSGDQRFGLQLSSAYTTDNNSSPNLENITSSIALAPNFPLFDAAGRPTPWSGNPAMDLHATAKAQTSNLIGSVTLHYALTKDLTFKLAGGYNKINTDHLRVFPSISQLSTPNYTQFNQNVNESVSIEPQLNYVKKLGPGELSLLGGGTFQDKRVEGQYIQAGNFSNEELMESLAAAGAIDARFNNSARYKYVSVFGRATYNLENKYILNLTARRDGSSRFGEGDRFGNFGSLGAAWLFGDEEWFRRSVPVISYGKLRASYGTTGNDQIADYQFLSTYSSSGRTYQGVATLRPARIQNDNFHWETTRKMEVAIELGLLNNRILLNVNYYRNRSADQLINYNLPAATGFISYQANLPAVVQNTGLEFELTANPIRTGRLQWTSTFNLTLPRNQLVSFQNFESSSYAQTYVLGYDITRIKGYHFLGVNNETGNAIYADINGKPAVTTAARNNNYTIGKTAPDLYGGFGNTLRYKDVTLDILFQFTRQMSRGAISNITGQRVTNYYPFVLDRWQRPGMETNVPRATTITDSNYGNSSANYFNASYIRLKNVSLNYRLPAGLTKKMRAAQINVFIQGQNLCTFWNDKIPLVDPEAGALTGLQAAVAPSRSIVTGLKFTF